MSNEINEVRRTSAQLAGLYAYGHTPDPEVEAALRCQLATAKLDRAIREAAEVTPPLHPAQIEYLVGRLTSLGDPV